MKNFTQEIAQQVVSKATETFQTARFGSRLSNLIGVPQPYVSKLNKFALSGDSADLPPSTGVTKFLTFLNASVTPENIEGSESASHSLILSVRNNQTNKFEAGVKTSPEQLREVMTGETPESPKNDQEVLDDIKLRFRMANHSVSSIFRGGQSGVIISGPAGCGKSFNVEKKIEEERKRMEADGKTFNYKHLKGATMSHTGLYRLLYDFREGGVIVFDDSDKLWGDEAMMNLMKSAMDTSKKRFISTASGGSWVRDLAEDNGVEVDDVREFEFKGKIIFITNKDINGIIEDGKKGSEHFAALVDRSFYIDLEMFTLRAKYLWCEHVFMDHVAPAMKLSDELTLDVLEFVEQNKESLREVSIRGIEIIANAALDAHKLDDVDNDSWKEFIKVARFKRTRK